MKFSVGDKVVLKHTGAEGRVVGMISPEMMEIEIGGTHFPVFIDEMEHPYLNWFMEKTKPPLGEAAAALPPESSLPKTEVSPGFHLSFLPVFRFDESDDVVDKLRVYFLNQTQQEITLQYECHSRSGILCSHATLVAPFVHFYLQDIPFEQMNEQPRFSYILEQTGGPGRKRIQGSLRIKPKKLFEYLNEVQQENKAFFSILLTANFPETNPGPSRDTTVLKPERPVAKTGNKKKPIAEIDLHAEALQINTRGLGNYEILLQQLGHLESALDDALRLHQQSMVVIHGVGKGKLREEVHALLRSYPGVDFFLHDWSPRYGYGATQVFFR
jgi:hypothetical protein